MPKNPSAKGLATRGIGIVCAKIGLISNEPALIFNEEYLSVQTQKRSPKTWSLMTSLPNIIEVPFSPIGMDGYAVIIDQPGVEAKSTLTEDTLFALADFSMLEETAQNRNLSFFGNMGTLFEYILLVLEKQFGIFSFHAVALYNQADNEMVIFPGGAGSGKTISLLEGILRRGYQLFSTEMTHFRIEDSGVSFFKGSMFDVIRVGNLLKDFPDGLDHISHPLPQTKDPMRTIVAVNLEKFQTTSDVIKDPYVTIVFPRIESEKSETFVDMDIPKAKVSRDLFNSASEKISKSFQLYNGDMAALSLDSPSLSRKRAAAIRAFLDNRKINKICSILAGAENCWAWRAT